MFEYEIKQDLKKNLNNGSVLDILKFLHDRVPKIDQRFDKIAKNVYEESNKNVYASSDFTVQFCGLKI